MPENKARSWIAARCRNVEPCRAWVALVAVVICNMLTNLSHSFGVYYDALVEKYDTSRAAVGWVLSFRWVFIFATGIFISPFVELYGCKRVAFYFSILYGLSTALCALAPNVGTLYVIYGLLAGLGINGVFLASVTCLQRLFTTNRGLATGIAALGYPLGVIVHPFHTRYILDAYGVTGVFLLHGAFSFNGMVCAFALKPPLTRKPRNTSTSEVPHIDQQTAMSAIETQDNRQQDTDSNNDTEQPKTASSTKVNEPSSTSEKNDSAAAAAPGRLVFTGDKLHFLKAYFKGIADFSLLKNVAFVLGIIHYLLVWMVVLGLLTHVVSYAKFKGIPEDQATFLLSVTGLAYLCMTVVSAAIMNMSWSNPALFSGFSALSVSCASFVYAYTSSYAGFAAASVLVGISMGIAPVNLPLLVLYTVGLPKLPRGIAIHWTLITPSAVGSSSFVGWMYDMLGDYLEAFVVFGVATIVSLLLAVAVAIITERKKRAEARIKEDALAQQSATTKL